MFGELSLFDPIPRTSSASAVTHATKKLAVLPHDSLLPLLRKRPEISLHMLRALVQRLRRANDVTADLVSPTFPAGSRRRCSTWRNDSASRPTKAFRSTTT